MELAASTRQLTEQDLSETFKVPTKFIGATLLPILGVAAGGTRDALFPAVRADFPGLELV